MVRLTTANGIIEFEDRETTVALLQSQQAAEATAAAEALLLTTVYRVDGEADAAQPHGGLLTRRLQLSERSIRELITTGRLGYFCAGKKAYRVPERAVRRFEAGLPPLAEAA
jgi:hypothetical protein